MDKPSGLDDHEKYFGSRTYISPGVEGFEKNPSKYKDTEGFKQFGEIKAAVKKLELE